METVDDIIDHLYVMTIEELTLLGINIFEELGKRKDKIGMTNKLLVLCDCAKCGMSMQNESILSNDKFRARIHFKCYQCGNEVVVNKWWNP